MASDESKPLPILEVEEMILALYGSVPAHSVGPVQEALHRLQRSPRGWDLARDLLNRDDEKVRFFGALTLVVKLNTENVSLSAGVLEQLLTSIMSWIIQSSMDNPTGLVTRKLSTALVTFFLRFAQEANDCINRLIFCLHSGRSRMAPPDGSINDVLPVATWSTLQTAILFATDLAEEAAKMDMNSAAHLETYGTIRNCLPAAVALISRGLQPDQAIHGTQRAYVRENTLRCFHAWVSFTHRFFPRGDILTDLLRAEIPKALCVMTETESTFTASIQLLTEILTNQQGFLTQTHKDLLMDLCQSEIGIRLYNRLLEGDFSFENCQFGFFMLSLGEARLEDLVLARDVRSQQFLKLLRGLLTSKGYPVAEDRVFVAAVEFWSSFTEAICDYQADIEQRSAESEGGLSADLSTAIFHAREAVQAACRKTVFPQPAIVAEWDSTEREGFIEARKDVADLLQAMYAVSGLPLATMFATMIPQLVLDAAWEEVEAAAFCLGSLAECISGDPASDSALAAIFSSDLLGLIARNGAGTTLARAIPPRTRQTCTSLIERFAPYFERNTGSLPGALDLLFSVLNDGVLATSAARSVQLLCASCRSALVSEATNFLAACKAILLGGTADCLVLERVMGGIASVVQAIPNEHDRLRAVNQLLDMLFVNAQLCLQSAGKVADSSPAEVDSPRLVGCGSRCLGVVSSQEDALHHTSIRVLRCLLSLAKGLQAPADSPIDLDPSRMVVASSDQDSTISTELATTQDRIMAVMFSIQTAFPGSGEVVEAICSVLRAGLAESSPGPFVFSPAAVAGHLARQTCKTPRIGAFVSAACSFINSHVARQLSARMYRRTVLVWVIDLLHQMPYVDADPELAQNAIEFVCRLLILDTGLVMESESRTLSFFFSLTIGILDGHEPLPKAAAAEFWATLASLNRNNAACELVSRWMADFGPSLTLALVRNMGGNASRSELDKLSDPLKKLAAQHAMAAMWLETALLDPSFPSPRISAEEKRTFAKKVISLRGARGTNQVVRDFWLASRGSQFAYVS